MAREEREFRNPTVEWPPKYVYLRDGHAGGSWFYVTSQQPLGVMHTNFTHVGAMGHVLIQDIKDMDTDMYLLGYTCVSYVRILIKSEITFFAESQLQHHFASCCRLVSDKCTSPVHSPPPNCSKSTSQPQSAPHSSTPSGHFQKHGHWEGRGEEREKRRRIQKELPKLMNLKKSACGAGGNAAPARGVPIGL